MLLYFSVKNSRSFEHHATLSFVADDSLRLPQNVQTIEHYDFKVLKSATIYGANASGKTNFLKAFVDGISIIEYGLFKETLSSNKASKQTVATFHPNKNKDINVDNSTDYVYGILINGCKYEFRFSNNDKIITEERLMRYESGQKYPITIYARVFNQTEYVWYFDKQFDVDNEIFKSIKFSTAKSKLWLSEANRFSKEYNNRFPTIEQVCDFFTNKILYFIDNNMPNEIEIAPTLKAIYKNKKLKTDFIKLLKLVDFRIEDIKVQIKKDDSVTAQTRQTGFDKLGKTKDIFYDLLTENSTGTNRFLTWLLPWYQALIYDKILIIDEFGNSMHPILVEFLIKLFHDKKRKAQILFSTHYTELMNRSLFRDDQIWLVNKDHTGNSTLEPLSNYEVPDKVLLDKGYLQGLFKGIPHIADIEIQKARQLIPK
jgi:AAA15 family ATPase/GTPase